jgi:pyruvate-ferredoxin/flavodoxin oxidoreductase
MLARSDPDRAEALLALAQADIQERWRYYAQLAGMERARPGQAVHIDGHHNGDDEGDE